MPGLFGRRSGDRVRDETTEARWVDGGDLMKIVLRGCVDWTGVATGVRSGGVAKTSFSPSKELTTLDRWDARVSGRGIEPVDCTLRGGVCTVLVVAVELYLSTPLGRGFAVEAVDWDAIDVAFDTFPLSLSIRSWRRWNSSFSSSRSMARMSLWVLTRHISIRVHFSWAETLLAACISWFRVRSWMGARMNKWLASRRWALSVFIISASASSIPSIFCCISSRLAVLICCANSWSILPLCIVTSPVGVWTVCSVVVEFDDWSRRMPRCLWPS